MQQLLVKQPWPQERILQRSVKLQMQQAFRLLLLVKTQQHLEQIPLLSVKVHWLT